MDNLIVRYSSSQTDSIDVLECDEKERESISPSLDEDVVGAALKKENKTQELLIAARLRRDTLQGKLLLHYAHKIFFIIRLFACIKIKPSWIACSIQS